MTHTYNNIPTLFNSYLLDQSDASYERVTASLYDFARELAYEFCDKEDVYFDFIIDDISLELSDFVACYTGSDFELDAREHIIDFLGIDNNTPSDWAA